MYAQRGRCAQRRNCLNAAARGLTARDGVDHGEPNKRVAWAAARAAAAAFRNPLMVNAQPGAKGVGKSSRAESIRPSNSGACF
jgi:hypothetical protein